MGIGDWRLEIEIGGWGLGLGLGLGLVIGNWDSGQ